MRQINLDDIVQLFIYDDHTPLCVCEEIVHYQNKLYNYKEYTFIETDKNRKNVRHHLKHENGKWEVLISYPFSGTGDYEKCKAPLLATKKSES